MNPGPVARVLNQKQFIFLGGIQGLRSKIQLLWPTEIKSSLPLS